MAAIVGQSLRGRTVQVEPSDEELCRRIAGRDAAAFDLLVGRHQSRSYRIARSILGNDSDARDVSQEAFIRVYQSAGRFDARARFSTWFHRILVNLCIDHQRRSRGWRRFISLSSSDDAPSIDPPSEQLGPDAEAIRTQSIGRLREALAQLSPTQRAAVLLQAQEGFSSREIVSRCLQATTATRHPASAYGASSTLRPFERMVARREALRSRPKASRSVDKGAQSLCPMFRNISETE